MILTISKLNYLINEQKIENIQKECLTSYSSFAFALHF